MNDLSLVESEAKFESYWQLLKEKKKFIETLMWEMDSLIWSKPAHRKIS